MAPDRDDHDDAQAVTIDGEGGSPPPPVREAAASGPEDVLGPDPEGGDTDTEGVIDTLGESDADVADAAVLVAESGGDGTENAIGQVVQPDDDPAATGPVVEEPEPDPGGPQASGPDSAGPETNASEPEPREASRPDVGASETAGTEAWAENGQVPGADEPEPVGFDGRPLTPEDGAGTTDETTDEATDEATDGRDEVVPPPPPPTGGQAPRASKKAVVVLTVLSLVVVGAGVGALIWSRSRSGKASSPPPRAQTSPQPTLSDGAFVTFTDPETGFTMRYPRGWTRSVAPVREIRLLVSDGKQYSALVRVTRTEVATTPANLANVKAVTDGVVGPGAQILKQDPITVNGLIGYRYIYTLTDKDSGLTTAHLHYFLFQGHKMNSIVLESLPSEGFDRIAGVFDQMLASFHSDPEPP